MEFEKFIAAIVGLLENLNHSQLRALVSIALVDGGEMGDGGYGDEGKSKQYREINFILDKKGEEEEYESLKEFGSRDALNLLVSGGF